jgi:hypothetical protein
MKPLILSVDKIAKIADETPGFGDVIEILEQIAPGMFGLYSNIFRYQKTLSFYKLAMEAKGGAIVELGAYRGYGTIALCKGAERGLGQEVHPVDLYADMNGWAGESYSTRDEKIFWKNVDHAGVKPILHRNSFIREASFWNGDPVSLLIWDGGVTPALEDVAAWLKHIIPGGVLAMRDTMTYSLHCDKAAELIAANGGFDLEDPMPGGMIILRRAQE